MRGKEPRFGRDFFFFGGVRVIFFFTTVCLSPVLEAPALGFADLRLGIGNVFEFVAADFFLDGFVTGVDIFSAGGSSTCGSGAAGNSSV